MMFSLRFIRVFALAAASLLGGARAGLATSIHLPYTVTGVSHDFDWFSGMFLVQITTIETNTLPNFTANLVTADSITLSFHAPEGYRFAVTPKGDEPNWFQIMTNFHGENNQFGDTVTPPMTVNFHNLQGPLPPTVPEFQSFLGTNANEILFDFIYSVEEPFWFTGWTATMHGPFAVSDLTYEYRVVASTLEIGIATETDLGPTIALVPIPEGSFTALAAALLALGAVASIRRPR